MGMTLKRRKFTPAPEPEQPRSGLSGLASRLRADPRVQELSSAVRHRAEEVRASVKDRADQHLEHLMESRGAGEDVQGVLAQRRQERDLKAGQLRARAELLALADTPQEKRVLLQVADATPWAGGKGAGHRYTQLLDSLAPSGSPEDEMAVHRALWSLAERQVLSISPHGEVRACPPTLEARVLTRSAVQNDKHNDDFPPQQH